MKRLITLSVFLILGLAISACATPPIDDMNRAQDAVLRAENDADAVVYAGNVLIRARNALARMQTEADAKRYEEAKTYAGEAIRYSEQAIADGKYGAERARQEAAALLNSLGGSLEETSGAISAAREAPDISLDFDAVSQSMDSTRQSYDDALQSLQAENYLDAIAEGRSVSSSLSSINTMLNEAAQDANRKK